MLLCRAERNPLTPPGFPLLAPLRQSDQIGQVAVRTAFRGPLLRLAARLGRLALASAPWLLAVVPIVVITVEAARYAVNVPLGDEWMIAPLVVEAAAGRIDPRAIWAQHNEHRLALPRLLIIALSRLTRWDVRAEIGANIVVATIELLLLGLLLRRSIGAVVPELVPWLVAAVSFLIFSLVQSQNWTLGLQLLMFVCATGVLVSALAIDRALRGERWVALAALGVGLSAPSHAAGLIVLLLIPIALLVPTPGRPWRRCLRQSLPAVAIGVAFIALYMVGWHPAYGQPRSVSPFAAPADFARFILAALGAAIGASSATPAQIVAVCGLATLSASTLYLWMDSPRHRAALVAWLLIAAYAVGAAGLTAVGRLGGGVGFAFVSRYTTFSLLLWCALVGVVGMVCGAASNRKQLAERRLRLLVTVVGIGVTAISLAAYTRTLAAGDGDMAARAEQARIGAACLQRLDWATNGCLISIFWNPPLARSIATDLRAARLGPYANPISEPPLSAFTIASDVGSAGGIEFAVRPRHKEENLLVSGYAIDPIERVPARTVVAAVGEEVVLRLEPSKDSEAAIQACGDSCRFSGFLFELRTASLGPGPHSFDLYAELRDGRLAPLAEKVPIPEAQRPAQPRGRRRASSVKVPRGGLRALP